MGTICLPTMLTFLKNILYRENGLSVDYIVLLLVIWLMPIAMGPGTSIVKVSTSGFAGVSSEVFATSFKISDVLKIHVLSRRGVVNQFYLKARFISAINPALFAVSHAHQPTGNQSLSTHNTRPT